MKGFFRSKLVLSLAALIMIAAAIAIPLARSITRARAQGTVTISEFPITTANSNPQNITSGPDGNLWFTEFNGEKIGKITPSGTITEYAIPTSNANPYGITSGPDGNVWFTESFGPSQIGKITPNGTITEYPTPTCCVSPSGITSGPDGNLWFTENFGNKIAKVTTSGTFTEYPIPTNNSGPGEITSGPDGNLWFSEANANQIGKITTGGTITEYAIPTSNSNPVHITSGPDGNVWFTESQVNQIGKITPSGTITEYPIPTSGSDPIGITSGPDGNLWFTEYLGGNIGNITPGGTFTEYPIPSGFGHPNGITSGPDKNIWFIEGIGNAIGRVNLSSPPLPSITVNPTQGSPGTEITVTGSNWTSGDVVDISLSTSASVLTKATVASDGTFNVSFNVPGNATLGPQFVNAKDETTGQTAQASFTVTRGKLFVLVQGINSKLTSDQAAKRNGDGEAGFFDTKNNVMGIVPNLQTNDYQNARFVMFSYTGYYSNGKPMSYTCRDTFVNTIRDEAKQLGKQINAALQGNPNQDVYIIAHSMGGLIAMTYLTALVETQGIVSPLPTGAKLQAIVTLDSPIGGVENTKEYLSDSENFFRTGFIGGCGDLLSKDKLTSLKNMANLFPTATNIDAQGETASILTQFLGGPNVSNQKVMEDARQQGVSILTISNLIDLLWLPKTACGLTTPDFPSTAWINDEGSNSGIYHRDITSGSYFCYLGLIGNGANHFDVLNNNFVETAIVVFLGGNTPPNY
jgi:streptogramin lyase